MTNGETQPLSPTTPPAQGGTEDTGEKNRRSGGFDPIIAQITGGYKELENKVAAKTTQIQHGLDETDAAIMGMNARLDDLNKSYQEEIDFIQQNKAPEAKVRSPLEAFNHIAALAGALMSLKSRRPLTSGLNAAAGAITAARQNDWDNYQVQYQNWKVNTDHALEVFKLQNEQLKNIIDSEKLTVDQKFNKMRLLGELTNDPILLKTSEIRDLISAEQLQISRAQLGESLALHKGDIERQKLQMDAFAQLESSPGWQKATATEKFGLLAGLGGKSQTLSQLQAQAVLQRLQQHPGETISQAIAATKAETTPQSAAFGKLLDSTISQADDLIKMIDANPNVVGTRGRIGGALQTLRGIVDPRSAVDQSYQQFETAMMNFRTQVNLAVSTSKYLSKERAVQITKALPGLESFTSAQDAKIAITQMKALLEGVKADVPENATENDFSGMTDEDLKSRLGIP